NNINIKLFSGFNYEQARFGEATESWFRKTKKSFDIDVIIEAFQGAFMIAIDLLILYIAVRLWRKDLLTIGDFVLIQAYLLEIFLQLWNFGRVIRSLYEHLANADEMTEILNKPYEVKDRVNAKMLDVSIGKIEFKNVNFSYDDGAEIMNDLSFEVKPGEKIALIGPSGGGKSTIVKLLLRLYNLKKGDIFIDGQNIADVTQDSLRQAIALVPQDPILFHRTLMDNIRYGKRNATEAEVIEAAKLAHAHEFVSKFKAGYESFVGERGIKLSGGERQRVAIARAILANPKILILDEATSQLDSESELFIKEALKVLMAGKTSFVIAHRLSTIMQMDRIFVIENGRIAEQGTHKTLLEKDGGIYKKLWDLQVNGFIKQIEGDGEDDEKESIISKKAEDLT
ncbi:MAG: ABC transporter ATP-binding protein, partial [Candidatus Gracilibacteria bacterium]